MPVLPTGARGYYVMGDYITTPRKTIPNRMASGSLALDGDLLGAPRRMFQLTGPWSLGNIGAGNSLTDNTAVGPDGATEFATITAGGTVDWQLRINGNTWTLPAGTYTLALTAMVVSGSADFRMGDNTNGGVQTKTLTGSYAPYTKTFTLAAPGSSFPLIQGPSTPAAATIRIGDVQVFAGAADLNPSRLSAAPLMIQREDIRVGKNNYDATISVSGGYFVHGTMGLLQLLSNFPMGAFSFVGLAKKAAAPSNPANDPLLASAVGALSTKLTLGWGGGLNSGAVDYYGGSKQSAWTSVSAQVYPDLNWRIGDGAYLAGYTYDGTTLKSYMNGTQTQQSTVAPDSSAIRDLWIGLLVGNQFGGQDIAALGVWQRALSAAEVNTAGTVMQTDTAIPMATSALIAGFGTSISYGSVGKSYLYNYPAGASKAVHGFNGGIPSAGIGPITAAIDAFLTAYTANITKPAQTTVLSVECGANDLNGIAAGNTALCDAWLASLVSRFDAARALGIKTVGHTVLSRTDGDAQSITNINTNRAYVNPIIRSWVGTGAGKHLDAVCDIGGDATVGTDTSTNNLTNFPDKVHPSAAMYTTYWNPLYDPAVNGII